VPLATGSTLLDDRDADRAGFGGMLGDVPLTRTFT